MTDRAMTAGEALRIAVFQEDGTNPRTPFAEMNKGTRDYWETKAARILSDAAAIRERMGEVADTPEALATEVRMIHAEITATLRRASGSPNGIIISRTSFCSVLKNRIDRLCAALGIPEPPK